MNTIAKRAPGLFRTCRLVGATAAASVTLMQLGCSSTARRDVARVEPTVGATTLVAQTSLPAGAAQSGLVVATGEPVVVPQFPAAASVANAQPVMTSAAPVAAASPAPFVQPRAVVQAAPNPTYGYGGQIAYPGGYAYGAAPSVVQPSFVPPAAAFAAPTTGSVFIPAGAAPAVFNPAPPPMAAAAAASQAVATDAPARATIAAMKYHPQAAGGYAAVTGTQAVGFLGDAKLPGLTLHPKGISTKVYRATGAAPKAAATPSRPQETEAESPADDLIDPPRPVLP